MSKTKIIELIYTEERKGTGVEGDSIRMCPQLWTKDGELIAESDMRKNEDNFFLNLQELKKEL